MDKVFSTKRSSVILAVLLLALPIFLWLSCEKEVDIDLPVGEEALVVYGYIEQDEAPVVFLTRSLPVFGTSDPNNLQNSFVKNATIRISNGTEQVQLAEYSLADLDDSVRGKVMESLGFGEIKDIVIGISLYSLSITDWGSKKMYGEVGKTYSLYINVEGQTLTSKTKIPELTYLDSLWTIPANDPELIDLEILWVRYNDPDTTGNYARYFTGRNSEPFYPGYFVSVFDDDLINGKSFNFPIDRGQNRNDEVTFDSKDEYGYFRRGDTIRIRWCSIDRSHFLFWQTLEVSNRQQGSPFDRPIKIVSNIEGGLGIWGGYGATYDTLYVPK